MNTPFALRDLSRSSAAAGKKDAPFAQGLFGCLAVHGYGVHTGKMPFDSGNARHQQAFPLFGQSVFRTFVHINAAPAFGIERQPLLLCPQTFGTGTKNEPSA